jgi:O-antigen ligase
LSEDASQRIVYKSDDSSVSARLYSAKRSLELFLKSPTFGHGLGSHLSPRTRVGPHNQYLIIAVEQGIIGLLLYISLLFIIWQMNSDVAKIFIICLCFFSFFDHNILDFPSTWLSIYLAAIATTRTKKVRISSKTKRVTAVHIPQSRLRRTL